MICFSSFEMDDDEDGRSPKHSVHLLLLQPSKISSQKVYPPLVTPVGAHLRNKNANPTITCLLRSVKMCEPPRGERIIMSPSNASVRYSNILNTTIVITMICLFIIKSSKMMLFPACSAFIWMSTLADLISWMRDSSSALRKLASDSDSI